MNKPSYSIIITGASRGIGRAIAEAIAGDPEAALILNYVSSEDKANEVAARVVAAGSAAVAVRGDVSRESEAMALYDAAERIAPVRYLINSAGVILYKTIAETSFDEFRRVFEVNVYGTFFTCREAARRMGRGGKIINFSSTVNSLMLPTYATYAASKGAVEQLTRHLAKELGPKGITINAVAPGATATDMFITGKSKEVLERFAAMTSFNRLGEGQDIAGAVRLLLSKDADWITGQVIRVNGGVT